MTLLTIVQQASRLLRIPVPSQVVASTDSNTQLLYGLANEEGETLSRGFDWQQLMREQTFLTVAGADQTDAFPDDFDRFLSNSTYDRTTIRPVLGPITPQQWQAIQAYPQINSVYVSFRIRDNIYLATPNPQANDTVAFEYITDQWCQSAAEVGQTEFLADTDTARLPERLFVYGLRWRFRKTEGLDYAEDFRTYENECEKAQSQGNANGTIDITGRNLYNPLGLPNIPVGNFPG